MIKQLLFLWSTITCIIVSPLFADTTMETQFQKLAEEPGAVSFTPPQGWRLAERSPLTPHVELMLVGEGKHEYPPSINLVTVPYHGDMKGLLKEVKLRNSAQKITWKDLGTIRTDSGNGKLSQLQTQTEWGEVQMMHVMLIKSGRLYILTAAALKEEFPSFYKQFFTAFRSLRINKDAFEMIPSTSKREALHIALDALKDNWKEFSLHQLSQTPPGTSVLSTSQLFDSEDFQKQYWQPFQKVLATNYSSMGEKWQRYMIEKTEQDLLDTKFAWTPPEPPAPMPEPTPEVVIIEKTAMPTALFELDALLGDDSNEETLNPISIEKTSILEADQAIPMTVQEESKKYDVVEIQQEEKN